MAVRRRENLVRVWRVRDGDNVVRRLVPIRLRRKHNPLVDDVLPVGLVRESTNLRRRRVAVGFREKRDDVVALVLPWGWPVEELLIRTDPLVPVGLRVN